MAWKRVRTIRKFAIRTLNTGVTYNIESLTGIKFKNVNVFYSLTEYYASSPRHHINITYTLNYPNIIFNHTNFTNIFNGSPFHGSALNKVTVFFAEGDI